MLPSKTTPPTELLEQATITIQDSSIASKLFTWGTTSEQMAVVIIRLVASIVDSRNVRRVLSTSSSRTWVVFPSSTASATRHRKLEVGCPLRPASECPGIDMDQNPPCPGSYAQANDDPRYQDDSACIYPRGSGDCEWVDLRIDHDFWCLINGNDPDFCFDGSIDINNCFHLCGVFHNGADGCVRNGQTQCCYGGPDGALKTNPNQGAGTNDCFAAEESLLSWLGHQAQDVAPYIFCCGLLPSIGLGNEACDEYYENRKPKGFDGYEEPRPAWTFGDPHMRTMDGLQYTFNGAGEYVAFCGPTDSSSSPSITDILDLCRPSANRLTVARSAASVHYRFAPRASGDLGTVTVAVAVEDPLHRNGEFAIAMIPNTVRRVDVFDGNTLLSFPPVAIEDDSTTTRILLSSGATISRTANISAPVMEIVLTSPSGIRLAVQEVSGVMVPSITPAARFSGRSVGLYGIYDGDSANDLTSSVGTTLDLSSSNSQAETDELVFTGFGQTWLISQSTSSLFQAFDSSSQSFDSFSSPITGFTPVFEAPTISDPDLLVAADGACGGIESESLRASCFFDIAATGDPEVFGTVASLGAARATVVEQVSSSPPEVVGPLSQNDIVDPGANTTLDFTVNDPKPLISTLARNDGGLFALDNNISSPSLVRIFFRGTTTPGTYLASVSVTNGGVPVLISVQVQVSDPPEEASGVPFRNSPLFPHCLASLTGLLILLLV
mmetsp:Transcript_11838/g.26275  ORF Transcript_11838/g.26275 Transcript_11838/m.26275 type:complete len:723 (-) Transcript_11838:213-2381(-)